MAGMIHIINTTQASIVANLGPTKLWYIWHTVIYTYNYPRTPN